MNFLLTGLNGTVAPALATHLRARGHRIAPWDRSTTPTDTAQAVQSFIESCKPDWVCHIATGSPDWAQWIAQCCAARGINLLWTSSVSIFSEQAVPPLTPETTPDATDDYGRYKIECEQRVRKANPRAIIARLGWQIGDEPGSNNMTDYLSRTAAAAGGRIEASTRWVPSCAFLQDTAEALATLMTRAEPGTYNLEGNPEGLSMFDIATRLNRAQQRNWTIAPLDVPHRDNRMKDDRVPMRSISDRI